MEHSTPTDDPRGDSTPPATHYALRRNLMSGDWFAIRSNAAGVTGVSTELSPTDVDAIRTGPAMLTLIDYDKKHAQWAEDQEWYRPAMTFVSYAPGSTPTVEPSSDSTPAVDDSNPSVDLCHHGNQALYCQRCDDEAADAAAADSTPTEEPTGEGIDSTPTASPSKPNPASPDLETIRNYARPAFYLSWERSDDDLDGPDFVWVVQSEPDREPIGEVLPPTESFATGFTAYVVCGNLEPTIGTFPDLWSAAQAVHNVAQHLV